MKRIFVSVKIVPVKDVKQRLVALEQELVNRSHLIDPIVSWVEDKNYIVVEVGFDLSDEDVAQHHIVEELREIIPIVIDDYDSFYVKVL